MRVEYFAYGSNILSKRLQERIPNAIPKCTATLRGYTLTFTKLSRDGSAKANIEMDPNGLVIGVVYGIDRKDFLTLDRVEKGYRRTKVNVQTADGVVLSPCTYACSDLTEGILPNRNYLNLIIEGAKENAFPVAYINRLEETECSD
jgi:AIG2-like family